MLQFLLLLLLASCCNRPNIGTPDFSFKNNPIPIQVREIRFSIDQCSDGVPLKEEDKILLAKSLKLWSQKRFIPQGQGVLEINLKLVSLTKEENHKASSKNAMNNHAVQLILALEGSPIYSNLDIIIQAHRSSNFADKPPALQSEEWAQYLTNLVNSLDTQVIYALRCYGKKLIPTV